MKILTEQILVDEVRELADKAVKRIWLAVPYLGSFETIQRILGINWLTNHKISIKLLTDINEQNSKSVSTISAIKKRGVIRNLNGLHAKIFILDDYCIIGSANLTNTSFTKRYEASILLSANESNSAINLFNEFWKKGKPINDSELEIAARNKTKGEDEGHKKGLKTISELM